MKIFPAIDIKGGKCVRLLKGDFANLTQYKRSPLDQDNVFASFGFKYLHLIDLDGALEGRLTNKNIIQNIAKINNIKIQVGGGVRSLEQIDQLQDEWSSFPKTLKPVEGKSRCCNRTGIPRISRCQTPSHSYPKSYR